MRSLIETHNILGEECLSVLISKNKDYRGGEEDIFANFQRSMILGIPPVTGILLRMLDKHQRIRSFIKNGTLAVKSEPVKDAIMDLHNYTVLVDGIQNGVKNFDGLLESRAKLYRDSEIFLKAENDTDTILDTLDSCEEIMASRVAPFKLLASYSYIGKQLDV